jgi:hypothetical protein
VFYRRTTETNPHRCIQKAYEEEVIKIDWEKIWLLQFSLLVCSFYSLCSNMFSSIVLW